MNNRTLWEIVHSWTVCDSTVNSTDSILSWVRERNRTVSVDIHKNALSDSNFWFYDTETGTIHNKNNSFFSIAGFKKKMDEDHILQQPIILQQEIGFLGILCKKIDGVMHFLMQAKIEPGNINKIQLSPTIQATKSNFTQKHGGARPPYLEYFENASRYEIVVDQIQSEQSSRFYKKRNRNILLRVEEDIPVLPSHKWMTLGQIKRLMQTDNLVNMDTRTVLSCIPYCRLALADEEKAALAAEFTDMALFHSIFDVPKDNPFPEFYHYINDYKMFSSAPGDLIPLDALEGWEIQDECICCKTPYPYQVIFCDIAIEGREVKQWTQPLFEANGIASFGLLCVNDHGILKFLVHAVPEPGCFDGIELGPTVQQEAVPLPGHTETIIDRFFKDRIHQQKGIVFDHLLSEEGGRFYHEQNRNILIRADISELPELPEGYFLLTYRTLNELVQINNTLNIQLRNLLSLLEV